MRHLNRLPRPFALGTCGLLACGLFAFASQPCLAQAQAHPLKPFVKLAEESRDAIAAVRDYEALFTKRELVNRTLYTGQMQMKFRQQPFSVYLRFVDANVGREVIFAGPRYQNKLQAHETGIKGIVGTLSLDPLAPQAMAEGRHPITQIGMQKMIEAQIDLWKNEMKYGEAECKFYPNAHLQGTDCEVCECTHPKPRRQFLFHRTRLFIDKKTMFPVRMEQWGWPPGGQGEPYLIEEYTYTDIRPNVGLTDSDFDVRNRRYHF